MSREAIIWTIVFFLGGLGIGWRLMTAPHGVGTVFVQPQKVSEPVPEPPPAVHYIASSPDAPGAVLSWERTIGVWIAAILTLGVLSYLYRDNPLYKLVESIVVGVSAGYTFVVGFWDALVAKLFLKLTPGLVNAWAMPLQSGDTAKPADWSYIVPLLLGVMLFLRFVPRLQSLASWPLAYVVGMTAGLKLVVFLDADFIGQISSTILPFVAFTLDRQTQETRFNLSESIRNVLLVASVLCSLTYFYFSVEHRGVIRQVARCGIWVLMITFGSSFAFTVMGRITLLTVRMEFLLGRWLKLIEVSQ